MSKIVLFGTGKMAEIAHLYFTNDSSYEIVAFTADKEQIKENNFLGLPVVPFEEIEKQYPPHEFKMFIAVGYTKLNKVRASKYYEAKGKGYELVSYISSKIIQWGDLEVGDNCFICENQVFQPGVKVGNNVIIWCGNHFGHDVIVNDHVFISSHVVLSGNVNIGEYSFIGVNSTVRDNIIIAPQCLIGAGALILKNTKEKEVYISKPTEKYPINSSQFIRMMDI
jgi:sugar O-acyltransferase (sialic acid O-acetyltransferase NeuD family)